MDECSLCEGGLLHALLPNGTWHTKPCPACLTYLVTDDVREVAREWLGFDPWMQVEPWSAWVRYRTRKEDPERPHVLPLHLPAGQDLAVRVLAKRLECEPEVVRKGLRDFLDGEDWWLTACFGADLSDIPTDAARAIVLCLQATEVRNG